MRTPSRGAHTAHRHGDGGSRCHLCRREHYRRAGVGAGADVASPGRTRCRAPAACFASGPLETAIVSSEIGHAAALKMCFAAYTKGTTALLAGIMATAEATGVRDALEALWSRGGSDFAAQTRGRVRHVTERAWRFAGEMDEIAATFREAGLPGGFHEAAAELYRRIADYKDAEPLPALDEVLAALRVDD